ncbi:MAG: hypothetical protein SPL47_07970 [Bacteroidales bacterium]|nr:hypothetical protein [Bacteroidales bacterium]
MNSQNNQATKKGLILLSGVIIGILTGFFVAFTLLQKFNPHTRPVAKEEQPRDIEGKTADTVVKYVVYRYESEPGVPSRTSQPDSLETDSTLVELYGADLFLEDEEDAQENNMRTTNVAESKLIYQTELHVLHLDETGKHDDNTGLENKTVELQVWSTPIKNKISYNFNGKTLKLKGLSNHENIKVLLDDNNNYVLLIDKRHYNITTTSDFTRLSETPITH